MFFDKKQDELSASLGLTDERSDELTDILFEGINVGKLNAMSTLTELMCSHINTPEEGFFIATVLMSLAGPHAADEEIWEETAEEGIVGTDEVRQ